MFDKFVYCGLTSIQFNFNKGINGLNFHSSTSEIPTINTFQSSLKRKSVSFDDGK